MATNRANDETDRQPTEFEIRRAELVGQIGDVSRSRRHIDFSRSFTLISTGH